jgi:alkylhydroperoxidase family enzyme
MSWIEETPPKEWTGELARLKSKVKDPNSGDIDNIMSVHSLDAGSMKAHLLLYRQAMKGTEGLPKVDREMIALVVSKTNGCNY